MPTSIEAIVCIGLFVVPGYIALSIANMITPRHDNDSLQNILRCIAYSLVICALLSWAFILAKEHFSELWVWIAYTAIVVIGGTLAGFIIGSVRKGNCFRKAMERIGNNVNSTPSPWDYKFSQINGAKWIKATLTSEKEIYGLYSNNSDASSVADVGAGIYLEKTYDAEWKEVAYSDGVFIPYSSISMIEFFNEGSGETGGNQTEQRG